MTVELPPSTAVIFPVLSTAATSGLLENHSTVLSSVVSSGKIVAVMDSVSAFFKVRLFLLRLISLMGTITFTVHFAVNPPSWETAVMVVFPIFRPDTFPTASTVATDASEDVHVAARSVASDGSNIGVMVFDVPRSTSVLDSFMPVTGTITLTVHCAV